MPLRTKLALVVILLCGLIATSTKLYAQDAAQPAPNVVVNSDGTVQIPSYAVPLSSFLSPDAKTYVTDHMREMQDPELVKQDQGVPRFMKRYLERDEALFALERKDVSLGGVHTYTYSPRAGISDKNKARVLINLHGGGFSGCWPGCAELESMPISALMKIKVVTVDYREGPDNKFPAASEDVASVYRELLKTYKPQDIGIYGCSAGGMLTAMSLAWFQTHGLPTPGAVGIYCASAGAFGGDATYIAFPFGEGRMPPAHPPAQSQLGYFGGTDMKDPLVSPMNSPEILAKFPPTLLITGTRDFAMSGTIHTDAELTKRGVKAELHVWDGLFHGFFYNADVPESQDAFNVMISFFDRNLGTK
ncbi:Lipase LipU [Acidisarcina polymorpha]|uniref:Lipase LipU n=1 Tax=Acidisarcina polymorpha TaxID=2211140 RepID=A0A2Z5G2B1_9BACT|nr:alpha/beta hydrolase [Acidisarcina polymorpha]AXC13333.1 Lipase LipU [Acidisarcina polymorpha]